MISALLISLTLSASPSLHLQAPDWAFLQRQIVGDTTPPALVDAFLQQLDAEAAPLVSYASPFEAGGPDPFDAEELADPAAQATEAQAALMANAFLDGVDGLVQP